MGVEIYSDINLYVNHYSQYELVFDEYAIQHSLLTIFGTTPGSRIFRPTFGCPIEQLLFEPISSKTANRIEALIMDAVNKWEPRIIMSKVLMIPDYVEQNYFVEVYYTIPLLNNKRGNLNFAIAKG